MNKIVKRTLLAGAAIALMTTAAWSQGPWMGEGGPAYGMGPSMMGGYGYGGGPGMMGGYGGGPGMMGGYGYGGGPGYGGGGPG